MPIDFNSEQYKSLSTKEKLQIAVKEFNECAKSFEYYITNYAYIRHPNAGVIKIKPFDFQLDIAVPISEVLLNRRGDKAIKKLKEYKYKFNYEKWCKEVAEANIELSRCIPHTFHEFYKTVFTSPEYHTRIDTIILKSRQTGISTIFQQLNIWFVNYHPNVANIVLSKTDREAKKFHKDAVGSWELIPAPIRARKITKNEHELWVSITGQTSHVSGIQVLPPTPDAGRSFDPNLVVLDEFATYRNAEEVWAAVSMCVSAGGVIVIIATPKGIGNLYHKIWSATKKSLITHIKKSDALVEGSPISAFRPAVVHWSQMPEEEFKRRGFNSAVDWYLHMKAKLSMEGGEKLVAQELDLNFNASGDTIDAGIIEKLESNILELKTTPTTLKKEIPGLIIYEPPEENIEYMIGIDTSEGIGQDYHSFHVLKLPKDGLGLPTVSAVFCANNITVKQYKDIVKKTGMLYNYAWLNIEKNKYGHTLITYFVEDGDYPEDKILNKYEPGKNDFSKDIKGWLATQQSRTMMINVLFDFLFDNQDTLSLPSVTVEEFKTFENKNGKWEASSGYHDDNIISFALALVGYLLLPKYKKLLASKGSVSIADEIPEDLSAFTSSAIVNKETVERDRFKIKEKENYISRKEFDPEEIKAMITNREEEGEEKVDEKRKKENNVRYNYKYMSRAVEEEDDTEVLIY